MVFIKNVFYGFFIKYKNQSEHDRILLFIWKYNQISSEEKCWLFNGFGLVGIALGVLRNFKQYDHTSTIFVFVYEFSEQNPSHLDRQN